MTSQTSNGRGAVDFRYTGQAHELTIPMSAHSLNEGVLAGLVSSFHARA